MKYRSSTEIIDGILNSIGSGATKTHIMYRAYLSYSQISGYLGLLQKRQLIRFDEGTRLYTITEQGLKFMSLFQEIKELVPTADERNELARTASLQSQ
ncbi:MAG: winged helix-turn-helix domain-containing protein [Nitrososphaerales archaeon]